MTYKFVESEKLQREPGGGFKNCALSEAYLVAKTVCGVLTFPCFPDPLLKMDTQILDPEFRRKTKKLPLTPKFGDNQYPFVCDLDRSLVI